MKPSKAVKRHESTADFKERIATLRRTLFGEEPRPRRADGYYRRERGSAPTPSEVLGGAKMPKLAKPPKDIAKWLQSLGVKV